MRFYLLITSMILIGTMSQAAEPIVVLNYSQRGASSELTAEANNHPFRMDSNYHQSHKVMPDETLGHIMQSYYGGSGLNMTFVELAIVQYSRLQ